MPTHILLLLLCCISGTVKVAAGTITQARRNKQQADYKEALAFFEDIDDIIHHEEALAFFHDIHHPYSSTAKVRLDDLSKKTN